MARDTVVTVRAGEVVFAVITSFARVPVPGEHILLSLTDAQGAQLGPEYGYGKSKSYVPAIVRDTVLRQKDQWRKNLPNSWMPPGISEIIKDHIADLYVEAITTEAWTARVTRWTSGGDQP